MTERRATVPRHLRPASRRWVRWVLDSFVLETHHRLILVAAAEAWDRAQGAREIIDRDGPTYLDRFDQPRARPEITIERDSRIAFLRALRELALDVEPPHEAARPPARGGQG